MTINRKFIPIKLHYFFFMAASGPILPYLTVYGKELGISEIVMGSITAILPIIFLVAKPFFGYLADYFAHRRKLIFMILILSMSLFYVSLHFIPPAPNQYHNTIVVDGITLSECKSSVVAFSANLNCSTACTGNGTTCHFTAMRMPSPTAVCLPENEFNCKSEGNCTTRCIVYEDAFTFYRSFAFYGFVVVMSLSMIAFNVANSISDAICFDILGDDGQASYGKQRVWGAAGFGITALIAGLGMDLYSRENIKNYTPAFILVLLFTLLDLLCCTKLKLPKLLSSDNIVRDVGKLLKNKRIIIFLSFTTLAGVLDSFIIYFLFWFLEDLAVETNQTGSIKMLEGLTVAAETLGSEILFFPLSGKILNKIGYHHSFTICFFNYALRLGLISIIPSPWWVLAIELFMQGPTYALTYTVIVAYANAVSPRGASATMQGLVAGMDDGLGYALGSFIGGFLYRAAGGRLAFQYYSFLSLVCCVSHFLLYKFLQSNGEDKISKDACNSKMIQQVREIEDVEISNL